MPNYIYDDEDNVPMNEDPDFILHHVTGYLSRQEMNYVESGQADRDRAEKKEAEAEKKRQALEGVLDMLGLQGKCRECPEVYELAEGFLWQNGQISMQQMEFLKLQCVGCKGKGTGDIDPQHEKRLAKQWGDLCEWANDMNLAVRCRWCTNLYEVYGQYKDPDDEWDAMEEICGKCRYFGEGD